MAPVKKPQPVLESMDKSIKVIKKKKRQRIDINFRSYLYKVLKSCSEVDISKKSMLIMNSFVNDMLEKIATEAAKLATLTNRRTLTIRDIKSAVALLVPGELGKVANMQATNAFAKYEKSLQTPS